MLSSTNTSVSAWSIEFIRRVPEIYLIVGTDVRLEASIATFDQISVFKLIKLPVRKIGPEFTRDAPDEVCEFGPESILGAIHTVKPVNLL
jgi:hypothetical protein